MILEYSKITIKKSSNVPFGRPTHPKTNTSLTSWFWALEMVILFKLLVVFYIKLMAIHERSLSKIISKKI